jgi:hypothetical protein
MTCFDAGIKYKGLALEGEVNWRRVDHFTVIGPSLNFDRLNDYGYQVIGSGMVLPKKFQLYTAYSRIYGEYGDPWEFRAGVNFYPFKSNYSRLNAQYIYLHKSPVGNTSLPYTVGGTGSIYNVDFEINF